MNAYTQTGGREREINADNKLGCCRKESALTKEEIGNVKGERTDITPYWDDDVSIIPPDECIHPICNIGYKEPERDGERGYVSRSPVPRKNDEH